MNARHTSRNVFKYIEVSCLEERNDNIREIGMRYVSNYNLIRYKDTGESSIEIYVI